MAWFKIDAANGEVTHFFVAFIQHIPFGSYFRSFSVVSADLVFQAQCDWLERRTGLSFSWYNDC
jgi:hypothetical protein